MKKSFCQMTPDILYEIAKHLDYETFVCFLRCGKKINSLFQTELFNAQFIQIKRRKLFELCKRNTKKAFYRACSLGQVELVEHMFQMGDSNTCKMARCVRIACYKNHAQVLQLLLDKQKWAYSHWQLAKAFSLNKLDCVKVIIRNQAYHTSIHHFLAHTIVNDAPQTLNFLLNEKSIETLVKPKFGYCLMLTLRYERFECYKVLSVNIGIKPIIATLSFYALRFFKRRPVVSYKILTNWYKISMVCLVGFALTLFCVFLLLIVYLFPVFN